LLIDLNRSASNEASAQSVESTYAAALFVTLLLNGGEPSRSPAKQAAHLIDLFTPIINDNRSGNREMDTERKEQSRASAKGEATTMTNPIVPPL